MNRFSRLNQAAAPLAFAAVLLLAAPVFSQQPAPSVASATDAAGVPNVESQMKLVTARLGLSPAQQPGIRAILQDLHEATEQAVHDTSRPAQERFDQVQTARISADRRMRALLTAPQQQQLDQLEHEAHPELHGGIVNAASLPQ